jgi:chemotaxis methyl-accepting protein methylase
MARKEGGFYFMNNILKRLYFNNSVRSLKKGKYQYFETIELVHPDFKALIDNNSHFHLNEHNLFDKISGSYTVIRAMNILHFGYFSEQQLYLILNNIYEGLESNGLFIEGSNENTDSPVEGEIYKKHSDGFSLVIEPEKPSRIKDLVLSFIPQNVKGQ